jgi:hypothetical protein
MDQLLHWDFSQHKQSNGTDAFAPILKLCFTLYLIYVSGAVDFTLDRYFIFECRCAYVRSSAARIMG